MYRISELYLDSHDSAQILGLAAALSAWIGPNFFRPGPARPGAPLGPARPRPDLTSSESGPARPGPIVKNQFLG